ncbi:HAD family hydrolase [Candidatus Nanohalococcus occultus]|uniref:HAD superfamily hydrolase n=1 Tax=Candidatus Nanohalococcus occultus TaxID=2978047 RepID=A0ABY8CDQ9_9ARCH|nr:HAD superfamily hydrolase [Candidatus Nanohaloarchaeota archaeon SVXNc]
MKYDAVIFDKDGVLIDSMEDGFAWADRLRQKLMRERGIELTAEDLKDIILAQKPSDLNRMLQNHGLTWEDLQSLERKVAERKIQRLKDGEISLYPAAEKVLDQIDQPKAVVSNAPLMTTEFVVQYYNLDHHFETVLSPTTDDMKEYVKRKKPNPEMVREAIEKMEADNPLMVGDTSDDMEVAENAGIDCCLVNPYKPYVNHDPEYRFDSLEGLLEVPGLS